MSYNLTRTTVLVHTVFPTWDPWGGGGGGGSRRTRGSLNFVIRSMEGNSQNVQRLLNG